MIDIANSDTVSFNDATVFNAAKIGFTDRTAGLVTGVSGALLSRVSINWELIVYPLLLAAHT